MNTLFGIFHDGKSRMSPAQSHDLREPVNESTPEMTAAKACGKLDGAALKLHPSVVHTRNWQLL